MSFKPLPDAVRRRAKTRSSSLDDEKARNDIRQFYHFKCCVCKRKTSVVHEEKRRGAGGKVCRENSYLACGEADGGLCHDLLQTRHIYPICPVEPFDAQQITGFEMSVDVAKLVFEGRRIPPHITVTND